MLAYYAVQAAEFRMRHDAIFSEIKHFSWLISTLLASPLALLVSRQGVVGKVTVPFLIVLPSLGVAFSVLAFFVVRREFHFYNESEARLLFLEWKLGVTSADGFLDGRLSKAMQENFSVRTYSANERPLGTPLPWKARIRMLFLMEFWLFGLVGLTEVGIVIAFWLSEAL